MNITTQCFYVSSGRKNAMYTLRYRRFPVPFGCVDNYVCNLSTDPDLAEEKAKAYFEAWKERVGETETFKITFGGGADFDLFSRESTFSVEHTECLEMLNHGIMPIGKHKGKPVEDLPPTTILWYADQSVEEISGDNEYSIRKAKFFSTVCSMMLGYALDMGLIEKREAEKQAIIEKRRLSNHIGEPGKRMDFKGSIALCKELSTTQVAWNTWTTKFINVIDCDGDLVVYFGKPLGEKGDLISFKATIKEHNERDGAKQTIVQRPKIEEVQNEKETQTDDR